MENPRSGLDSETFYPMEIRTVVDFAEIRLQAVGSWKIHKVFIAF